MTDDHNPESVVEALEAQLEKVTAERAMSEQNVTRETALSALSLLASADALIAQKTGMRNAFRTATIAEMEKELGVVVSVSKENKK